MCELKIKLEEEEEEVVSPGIVYGLAVSQLEAESLLLNFSINQKMNNVVSLSFAKMCPVFEFVELVIVELVVVEVATVIVEMEMKVLGSGLEFGLGWCA